MTWFCPIVEEEEVEQGGKGKVHKQFNPSEGKVIQKQTNKQIHRTTGIRSFDLFRGNTLMSNEKTALRLRAPESGDQPAFCKIGLDAKNPLSPNTATCALEILPPDAIRLCQICQ